LVLQVVAPKPVQSESLVSLGLLRKRLNVEAQRLLVTESGFCLNCGGVVREHQGEVVCESCGQVWDENLEFEEGIPFETSSTEAGHSESHYSPSSQLAFGKAMGGVLDGKTMFRILAKAPSGNTDLPLRACFIKILTSKTDHPVVSTLLSYGSALCYQYGFKSNNDSDQLFSNQLGRLLRKIGSYYVLRNDNQGELRRVCDAIFYIQFAGVHPNEAPRVFTELGLTPELLRYVQNLLSFLQCPKKPKQKKPKGQD
jgi:hypothetical protein